MRSVYRILQNMTGTIGIDEVGRGPLAGPVTVCACFVIDEKIIKKSIFENTIRDSKKLNKRFRNNIYKTIRKNRMINGDIRYAIASRSASYIDRYGIVRAIEACVRSCVVQLRKQDVAVEQCTVRLDAGLKVPGEGLQQNSFIKGDEKYAEIALASIIAKVSRDAYMARLSKSYKEYSWERNVGYGTNEHRKAILRYGPSKHHRITYLKAFKQLDKAK